MNSSYISLAAAALLPVAMSFIVYLADKKTKFKNINKNIKQIIIGIIFGALAVLGTEWGININGAVVNCRDAAVLTAGLMFGAPAGIIAGLIGGAERWLAVAWGAGSFTQIACTVSTILAGFYAGAMRKFLFENKKPGWMLSFAMGVVTEVFHLMMVFVTNMHTPEQAMEVVVACSAPMIFSNAISVMLSCIVVSLLSNEKRNRNHNVRISQTIQRWLLLTVSISFVASTVFLFQLQTGIADNQRDSQLSTALAEVEKDLDLTEDINALANNHSVGKTGYVIILDKAPEGQDAEYEQNKTYSATVNNEKCYFQYEKMNDYYVAAVLPAAEANQSRNIAMYVNTYMEILIYALLFIFIYLIIKKVVVNKIGDINSSLAKIANGNLNETIDVRSNAEFASLSDDINSTVNTLKHYIDEASKRIDRELEFAKNIQSSTLPSIFPAFPNKTEFDIYASMTPAREVGGDFYDYYFVGDNVLAFLIADVSGKGIPAAMFMMTAKTLIKNLAQTGIAVDEVFNRANEELCKMNDMGMFVTAWLGEINLKTGELSFVNAGHNPPLVKKNGGEYEYLKVRSGLVLAGMEGINYRKSEIKLMPGDRIYLYTDGVTEATDSDTKLYGEERLIKTINSTNTADCKSICDEIKSSIDGFVGDAEQFDDITMLSFCLNELDGYNELTLVPSIESITRITEFVENWMLKTKVEQKTINKVNIAVDEIYSNIVKYSGALWTKVHYERDLDNVYITFTDNGKPYNPLESEEPNITSSADERQIGGLGIFMVKKLMDNVEYGFDDNINTLKLTKKL